MICRIADMLVEIPEAGGMAPRCRAYQTDLTQGISADIVINESQYEHDRFPNGTQELICYMESGRLFFKELLKFNGIMLHSSAVEYQGKAYLFSGPCGIGKSTHAKLWQQTFGSAAQVFNDDKPLLRRMDGRWYAYGAPWCGKDGINQNKKIPLAGICFLKQSENNCIRRLDIQEAAINCLYQTHHYLQAEFMDMQLRIIDKLVRQIPVYELENNAQPDCVRLSCETMRRDAEEAGL